MEVHEGINSTGKGKYVGRNKILLIIKVGSPGGLDNKKICLQSRRPGIDPWIVKIPWIRECQPTPVFLPGESHGQRQHLVKFTTQLEIKSRTTI